MVYTKRRQYSLGYYNFLRGLGILVIILGHSMALFLRPVRVGTALPVFAGAGRVAGAGIMAMFFMISGFSFKPRKPWHCIRVQTRLLLKRYWLTAAAVIAARWIADFIVGNAYNSNAAMLFRTYLFGFNASGGATFLGGSVGTVSIFWFILALFQGWVIYNMICCLKSKNIQRLLTVICVIAGWALTEITRTWPFSFPTGLITVGYIAVGAEIRDRDLLERWPPMPMTVAICVIALVSMVFGYADISVCMWELGIVDVMGSFCLGYLLLRLYWLLSAYSVRTVIGTLVEYIGLHSIWIFCIHGFENAVIRWGFIGTWFPRHPVLCMLLCFAARSLVICVLFLLLYRGKKAIRRRRYGSVVLEDDDEVAHV